MKRIYYFGVAYHCGICGASTRLRHTYSFDHAILRDLDVIGGEYVENDDCPICFANARIRLVYKYIKGIGAKLEGMRVLHVAPERALYTQLFSHVRCSYTPIDFEPTRYNYIPGITFGDISKLTFGDDSFDLILCNHVLEHVPEDVVAMRELYRVLAPGGRAILQVPLSNKLEHTVEDPHITDPAEMERRFGQFDHVRIYGPDYFDRLRSAGFTVELIPSAALATPEEIAAGVVNGREELTVAHKAAQANASASSC